MSDALEASVQAAAAAEDAIEQQFLEETENGGCACVTCIARVALEAAWPHLRRAAMEDAADELDTVLGWSSLNMAHFVERLHLLARGWRGE